jgi:hypothetical protein
MDPYYSAARGVTNRVVLFNGKLFFNCHATPYIEFKKLSTSTFARSYVNRKAEGYVNFFPTDDYLYCFRRGASAWSLVQFNFAANSESGNIAGVGDPTSTGACIAYEEYALYTCHTGIYSISVSGFTQADYFIAAGRQSEIIPLKDRYFATAASNEISVFYLNTDGTIRHVDSITLSLHGPVAGYIKHGSLISTIQLGEYS